MTRTGTPSFLGVVSAGEVNVKLETTPPVVAPVPAASTSVSPSNAPAMPPLVETSSGRIAAPLDAAPPPEEIVLHIQRGSDGGHMLRLYVDGLILEERVMVSPPNRVVDRDSSFENIVHARIMAASSLEVGQVLRRLRECEARHKDPWLCIDELEDTGIIWELLPIERNRPLLGVLFNVWRRSTLTSRDGRLAACNWTPRQVSGPILSYCAPDVRDKWPPDSHAPEPSDFASLRIALRDGGHNAALLYLYCHCHSSNSNMFTRLGDRDIEEQSVDTRYLFDGGERKLLTESQPIVFLNACGTANLPAGDTYLPGTQTRFAGLFLELGAVGVIATLAPPYADLAAGLGERIIALVRERAEVGMSRSVPEILRMLRREIYERYWNVELGQNPEAAHYFYHAFLYVYLGTPRAYLELD